MTEEEVEDMPSERDIGFLHASVTEEQRQLDQLREDGKERQKAINTLSTAISKLESRVARLEWVIGTATTITAYIVTKVTGLWHYLANMEGISTAAGAVTLLSGTTIKVTEEAEEKVKKIKDKPSRAYTVVVAIGLCLLIASAINLFINPIDFSEERTENSGAYLKGPPPLNPSDLTLKCEGGNLIITAISHPNKDVVCNSLAEIYRYWRLSDNTLELAYPEEAENRPIGAHFALNSVNLMVPAKLVMSVKIIPEKAVDYVTILSAPQGACTSPIAGIPGWWGNVRMSQKPIPKECFEQREGMLNSTKGLHQR